MLALSDAQWQQDVTSAWEGDPQLRASLALYGMVKAVERADGGWGGWGSEGDVVTAVIEWFTKHGRIPVAELGAGQCPHCQQHFTTPQELAGHIAGLEWPPF